MMDHVVHMAAVLMRRSEESETCICQDGCDGGFTDYSFEFVDPLHVLPSNQEASS